MKKIIYLLLLTILVITPYISNAEICNQNDIEISNISIKNKTGNVIEVQPARIENKTIIFNLNMYNVNDSITYKVNVKNKANEDYYLNKNNIKAISSYLDYDLIFEDNSKIIKPNSSKELYITIKYKTKVPNAKFVNGKYTDDKSFVINLANEELNNPMTNNNILLVLIVLAIVISITILVIKYNKKNNLLMLILLAIILLPISIYALCKYEIELDTKVTIYNENILSFRFSCSNEEFNYNEGMTFKDWLKSDFYKGNIGGEYKTLEQCESVWGSDKGCSPGTRYEYYYVEIDPDIQYTDSLEECMNEANCTETNFDLYKCEYAFEDNFFDSLEECEENYGEGECLLYNGKYGAGFGYELYTTEEETENAYNWAYYHSCSKLDVGYQYNNKYEYYEDSLEECIEYYGTDSCITETINYYSPTEKDGNIDGRFDFFNDGFVFVNGYIESGRYEDKIESKTYICDRGGECVDPNSDILSGNGKTIKAKDIKENDLIAYYDFNTNKIEIGTVSKIYLHKDATNFIKYVFNDNTYLKVTDYHPIYTSTGWKSYTNRNGYPKPNIGDLVKTNNGYKKIKKIVPFNGKEDYYDFVVRGKDGRTINNYFANGMLVQGSY